MFEIVSVPLNVINPNPYQPPHRLTPAKDVVARLAESIRNSGLKQTPTGRRLAGTDCVEIADGWLRFCAFRQLSAGDMNFMEMPVELHEYTDREMLDTVMEANTVRKDLTVIDLANIYKRYTEEFKVSQDELARMHNCSQGEVSNTLRLLTLPEGIQALIISHDIPETHARYLLQLKDKMLQSMLAAKIVEKKTTVADLDVQIRELLGKEKKVKPAPAAPPPPAPVPPPAVLAPAKEAGEELSDEEPGAVHPVVKKQTEPPAKATPAKTVTPTHIAPPPAAVKTTWKTKMVLEEKEGHVLIGVMADGKRPIFQRIEGDLYGAINASLAVYQAAVADWQKEAK